ncbi:hypothetical protein ACFU7Y_35695 [Kitasatospora sp. NPDC057542]|uniref:hypothetical protein n=1 Tax=Streptomycetaceae TaxID=2062 RepID=UPI001CD03C91|nr:hypothetical protein [Streptomyces sp. LS1784]
MAPAHLRRPGTGFRLYGEAGTFADNVGLADEAALTDAAQPGTYRKALGWLIAADRLEVAAAVVAVLPDRRLTAVQEQRFAEGGAHAYGVHGATVRG